MSLELTISKLVNYLRLWNFQLYLGNCSLGYEECYHDSNIHYFSKKYLFLYISTFKLENLCGYKIYLFSAKHQRMKIQNEKGWVMWLSSFFLNTENYLVDTVVWIFRRCFNMTLPSQFIFFPRKRNDTSLTIHLFFLGKEMTLPSQNWSMHKERGHTLVFRVMVTGHRWNGTSRMEHGRPFYPCFPVHDQRCYVGPLKKIGLSPALIRHWCSY